MGSGAGGMKSISSKDMTAGFGSHQFNQTGNSVSSGGKFSSGGPGMSFSSGGQNTFTPTPQPKKQEFVDPNLEEKKKLANDLFGGIGGGGMFGTTTTQTTKPTTSTTTTSTPSTGGSWGSTQQQKPVQQQTKQGGGMDLLDMDFDAPSGGQSQGSGNLLDMGGGSTSSGYQPLNIDLAVYENYWSSFPEELDASVQSGIRNASDFGKAIKKLNFGLISEVDNEVICAGKSSTGDIILLYAVINPNGKLDFKVKAPKQQSSQNFVNALRSVC